MYQQLFDFNRLTLIQNWVLFIGSAIFVIILAYYLPRLVLEIFKKTRLNLAFIGVVLLSFLTSLPEFLSTIFTVIVNQNNYLVAYSQTFANIVGANFFSATALIGLDLVFFRSYYLRQPSPVNRLTLIIVILINLSFVLLVAMPWLEITIQAGKISLIALGILLFYLGFTIWLGFYQRQHVNPTTFNAEVKHEYLKYSLNRAWLYGLTGLVLAMLIAIFFVFSSLGRHLQNYHDFSPQSFGGLFFAITTAFPELLGAISLFNLGLGKVAIALIFGSHFFNLVLFVISNLIFAEPAFKWLHQSSVNLTLITATFINSGLFWLHWNFHYRKPHPWYFIIPFALLLLYGLGWAKMIGVW